MRRENSPPDCFLVPLNSVTLARSRLRRRISSAWASTSLITLADRKIYFCQVWIDLVLIPNRCAICRSGAKLSCWKTLQTRLVAVG